MAKVDFIKVMKRVSKIIIKANLLVMGKSYE